MNNWKITPISDEKRHDYQITLCSVAVTQENIEKLLKNANRIERLASMCKATKISCSFTLKDNRITIIIILPSLLYFEKFQEYIKAFLIVII